MLFVFTARIGTNFMLPDDFGNSRMAIQMRRNLQRGDMRNQKGFSLIELLIVVAIILIIAAIAIPSLIRARISANESSAVASVRQISTAQIAYATSYAAVGYAAGLTNLGPGSSNCGGGPSSTNACILDSVLASGTKSGFQFFTSGYTGPPNIEFVSSSVPVTYNVTGVRNFCMVTDGVLRILPANAPIAQNISTCTAYPIAQ
jgi:prepilin-type N-terminal cleavage/methylation domain-containing protein